MTTVLKTQTTFVIPASNVQLKRANRTIPARVQCEGYGQCQIHDEIAATGKLSVNPSAKQGFGMGSIVIEGGRVRMFRDECPGLSVRAAILPELLQLRLQTSG